MAFVCVLVGLCACGHFKKFQLLTIDGSDVKSKKFQLLTPDGNHYLINRLMNMHDHTEYFTIINEVALYRKKHQN